MFDIIRNAIPYIDGRRIATSSLLAVPKLKPKTEKVFMGGVDGETEVEFGLQVLEAKLKLTAVEPSILKLVGLRAGQIKTFQFNAATVSEFDAGVKGVAVRLTGKIFDADPGDWKHGDKTEWDYRIVCKTYKMTFDSAVIHDIDPQNFIRIVDGVDQLALIRAALQMD